MTPRCLYVVALSCVLSTLAYAESRAPEQPAQIDPMEGVKIRELLVDGSIDGTNIAFVIEFDVETEKADRRFALMRGDAVLRSIDVTGADHRLSYDPADQAYVLNLKKKGKRHVRAVFSVRPRAIEKGVWREATFDVPASQLRRIAVRADRTDLEVVFPDAMRVEREVVDERLTLGAILGPGKPFSVRWKPQVQELDAELVASMEANSVLRVAAGSMKQDTLYIVDISQGRLSELRFAVPGELSITQVRGAFIRDWKLIGEGEKRELVVSLNREQTGRYVLQVLADAALPGFPAEMGVPVIRPLDIHARGNLMIGTDSAIAMRVTRSTGLSQIDNSGFPRIMIRRDQERPIPTGKAFSYAFASMPFQLRLSLADIVPSYDVTQRLVMSMTEEDLRLNAEFSIDVRDAPIRTVTIQTPGGYNVADVSGKQVADYRVLTEQAAEGPRRVEIEFAQPVLGNTLVSLRLELGRTPLDRDRVVPPSVVLGAKTQRGFVVVTAEPGVKLELSEASDESILKSVHTGSVPMRVADAQYAYRFRDTDWTLKLRATRREAGIVAEAFELVTLSEDIAYGTFVVNYFITGSPIDTFRFTVPERLRGLEFVGKDIARKKRDGNTWTVKLNRKVIGDYNIALTYNQRYADDQPVGIGAVRCVGTERQAGYVLVTSHLNLGLTLEEQEATRGALLPIEREEVPANYRLLSHAPILRSFKYADSPRSARLTIRPFDRVDLLEVVVEMMDIRTDLAVRESGETESITRIIYHVKNTSRQFLKLRRPDGARVMRVSRIKLDEKGRIVERQRLAASADEKDSNMLLVPLARNLNPNDPIMIELELSQLNGTLGVSGELGLVVPDTRVPATYADWKITVPEGWSIRGRGGNMVNASMRAGRLDMAWIGGRVSEAWSKAAEQLFGSVLPIVLGVVWLGAIGWCVARGRRFLPNVILGGVLLLFTAVGVMAATHLQTVGGVTPGSWVLSDIPTSTDAAFTRVVKADGVDGEGPLSVALKIVPVWREHVSATRLLVVPIVSIALLAGAGLAWVVGRGRERIVLRVVSRLLLAAGLMGGLVVAAQFPAMSGWVALLLTAAVPVVLLACFLWRCFGQIVLRHPARVAATTVLLLSLGVTGCVESAWVEPVDETQPVIEHVEAVVTADADSLIVDMTLRIEADEPMTIPLLGQRAVLLSSDEPMKDVKIERGTDNYVVRVLKRGSYEVNTRWLAPLDPASADRIRQLHLSIPMSLSNHVVLVLPTTEVDVSSPTAVSLETAHREGKTYATASFGPMDRVSYVWKPSARQREHEDTVYYGQGVSVYRFDAGLIEGRHRVDLQVAQGVLQELNVTLPEGMTVTRVQAPHVGAWRYEPADRTLEVKLSQPVAGDYQMTFVTQVSLESLPHEVSVGGLVIDGAKRQQATVGLVTSSMVYIEVDQRLQRINVDDFARDAADLLKPYGEGVTVRHAFRIDQPGQSIAVGMNAVRPELRTLENASFTVADDRLTYNGQFTIDIAKAGKFSAELLVPAAYDIDTLTAEQVSHWDEKIAGDHRSVVVHFRNKLTGRVVLNLTLSRAESELPRRIEVPRVRVEESIKHTGRVVLSAVRGVSLTVTERQGVSELRAADLGIRQSGTLVYKLLQPEWKLAMETEVVEPLITAEFLHVADLSEGVVRHTHYLRYKMQNAGTKEFVLKLPAETMGLQILGPNIARREEVSPGRWRVELTGKWFDQPYPLTMRYETKHDREAERIELVPVEALGTDRQRGHVVINKSERFELSPLAVADSLRPAEPRNIPSYFMAGDLSGAAYCYASASPGYNLTMQTKRLSAAGQLEASVEYAKIYTVVTENGQSINRVNMRLRVGSKRLLETRLPEGAEMWSLKVNDISVAPSRRDEGGQTVLLIPLALAALGELPVDVEMIYVQTGHVKDWDAAQAISGPRFDLPLRNISWRLFVPEGYAYSGFDGTLAVNAETTAEVVSARYNLTRYHQNVQRANVTDINLAEKQQRLGNKFAIEGRQYEARQLLEQAYNNSVQRDDLNEDIRVDLHNLRRQQAMVGLVGTRDRLRYGQELATTQQAESGNDLGDAYKQQDVDRVFGSLSQADNDNLTIITRRLVEVQDEATGQLAQLSIDVPLRGRVLEFTRPLQVEENTPMVVAFRATSSVPMGVTRDLSWLSGVYAGFALLIVFASVMRGPWSRWCDAMIGGGLSDAMKSDTDENA